MAKTVRSVASALTGAIAGASMMYYFDAASGRRRRAELGERSMSSARRMVLRLRVAGRDLGNRAGGLGARAVNALWPGRLEPAVLAERVRACLGRVISHPGAVIVVVDENRCVVLRGAVLAWEHEPLQRAVAAVNGVADVRDELAVYESAQDMSAPQGGQPRHERRPELLQDRWSPGMRLAMALAGGGLLLGSRRRGAWGALGTVAGGALLLRSVVNAPLRDIARGRGRRLEVRKSLQVRAPLERVFATLQDCEAFPSFMRHLTQVRRRADGTTHWVMSGPWGMPIEWQAITTQVDPNRLLAWRTTDSSPLQHWGLLRFEDDGAGGTRIHVYMSYQAPVGRLGQAVARLFGADPKSGLSEDLQRLKTYLEAGGSSAGPGGIAGSAVFAATGSAGVVPTGASGSSAGPISPAASAGSAAAEAGNTTAAGHGAGGGGAGEAEAPADWTQVARGRPH